MSMQLAFYKGPADGRMNQAAHIAVARWTHGEYSHVELLVSDGSCWSSSMRDGGVRNKRIALNTGRWDLVSIDADETAAVKWFQEHDGELYDFPGLCGFLLPWRVEDRNRRFCSEAIAAALGLPYSWLISPNDLYRIVMCHRALAALPASA